MCYEWYDGVVEAMKPGVLLFISPTEETAKRIGVGVDLLGWLLFPRGLWSSGIGEAVNDGTIMRQPVKFWGCALDLSNNAIVKMPDEDFAILETYSRGELDTILTAHQGKE